MRGGSVSSIRAEAQTVEHLQTLPGWGEFSSVYRVRAANRVARQSESRSLRPADVLLT
jgi:hypothetical protein